MDQQREVFLVNVQIDPTNVSIVNELTIIALHINTVGTVNSYVSNVFHVRVHCYWFCDCFSASGTTRRHGGLGVYVRVRWFHQYVTRIE